MTIETVNALLRGTVKTVDDAMGEKNSSFGRKPLEKQCMLASSQTCLRSLLLRPFFVITTESGNATCPSTLARPCLTETSDSVVLTMFVVKLSSSPAAPEPTLSKPAQELTSIPAWFSLWIVLPVTGSRMLDDTAPGCVFSPHTNALVVSVLKMGRSFWANVMIVDARTASVIVSVCRIVVCSGECRMLGRHQPTGSLPLFPSCASDSLRFFEDRLDLSVTDRTFQRSVVLFVLVGVGNGEGAERLVKRVVLT